MHSESEEAAKLSQTSFNMALISSSMSVFVTLSMFETDLSAFLDTKREMNILHRTRNSERE
jgi:hypothetical protein